MNAISSDQTIFSHLQSSVADHLDTQAGSPLTREKKAIGLFQAFIRYISQMRWRYDDKATNFDFERPVTHGVGINCFGLIEALRRLFHLHGLMDAESCRYFPCYGSGVQLNVPESASAGILHTTQKTLVFTRHVVLKSQSLYFDALLCCYYRNPNENIVTSEYAVSEK